MVDGHIGKRGAPLSCCADVSPSSLRFDMVMSLMSLRLLMARGLGCTHAQARYSLVTPGNDVLVIYQGSAFKNSAQ